MGTFFFFFLVEKILCEYMASLKHYLHYSENLGSNYAADVF